MTMFEAKKRGLKYNRNDYGKYRVKREKVLSQDNTPWCKHQQMMITISYITFWINCTMLL